MSDFDVDDLFNEVMDMEFYTARKFNAVGTFDLIFHSIEALKNSKSLTVSIKLVDAEGNIWEDIKAVNAMDEVKKAGQITGLQIALSSLAIQLGCFGQNSIAILNTKGGTPVTVYVTPGEKKGSVYVNYREAVAPVTTTTTPGPINGKDF